MTGALNKLFGHTGFRITISILLLLLCLSLINPAELVQAFAQINPWYFFLALILNFIGTVLVKAWIAYMTTHASGLSLRFLELIRINLIARFYTIALPRGASAAIRWHHYRKGGSGHAAATLLVFENLVSVFTLFMSAALILSIEYSHAGTTAQFLLPLAWLGTLATMFMLLPFIHRPSTLLFNRLLQPLQHRSVRISGLIEKLLSAITNYHAIPGRRIGSILLASVTGYTFFILSAWVLAEGMSLGVSLAAIAWVRSITLLVALIPITVAGIGLRETTLIALLHDYGIPASTAFAYAITSFSIQLVLGLLGALLEAHRVWANRHKVSANRPDKEIL